MGWQEDANAALKAMHSAAERGDWKSAIAHARKVPSNWGAHDQLPQYKIPPHAITDVINSLPKNDRSNFFFELSSNMHPGYSHDHLKHIWENSAGDYTVENAVIGHPNWKPTDPEQQMMQASEFWHEYEKGVSPHHFAAIKSMYTGNPEKIIDHRGGEEGDSKRYHSTIPLLKDHAQRVQKEILDDTGIQKRYFNGKPYVKLYRGVGGNYGKKLYEASALSHEDHSVEDKKLNVPVTSMASWTVDPDMAKRFALGRGNIAGQAEGHGVVMEAWHPVENILHSGFHKVHAGQRHAHPNEAEIIVGHPTGKVKVNTKKMKFQQSVGGNPGDDTHSFTDDVAHPQVRARRLIKAILDELTYGIEDFDDLLKAVQGPRSLGEVHPYDPNLVARVHPHSKELQWHTRPALARRMDEDIEARAPGFTQRLNPTHAKILNRAILDVMGSPTRHFRTGYDKPSKDKQNLVLRARHLNSLLSGHPHAILDLSDPTKVRLTMDRHRGLPGEKTTWTLTEAGGFDRGANHYEDLRRSDNKENLLRRGAQLLAGLYEGEEPVGDDPRRVLPSGEPVLLGRLLRLRSGVSRLVKAPRDNGELKKAPVPLPQEDADELGTMDYYQFNPQFDRHEKTQPVAGGMFHHVFADVKNPSLKIHILSQHQDYREPSVAAIEGVQQSDGSIKNQRAYVDRQFKGKGYGKQLYGATLLHHGKMISDNSLSDKSSSVWHYMKENFPGVHVSLARYGSPDPHVAVVHEGAPSVRLEQHVLGEHFNREEALEKRSKNVREQIKRVHGGWKTKPNSKQREKQMAALGRLTERRYGLGTERSEGKPNHQGKIIDKPTLANPRGNVQHIGNPDSLAHELAHIEVAPLNTGLSQFQEQMDADWGKQNVKYGYKQQARVKDEYETTALENQIRRRAGLPAHEKGVSKDKDRTPKRRMAADVPGKEIIREIPSNKPGGKSKWLSGTKQNVSPEAQQRMAQIDSGELVFDKERGWTESNSIHAKINRRARLGSIEVKKSEQDHPRKLIHYGHIPGLTQLDPEKFGTGHRGAEWKRGPTVKRTYYYFHGTPPEDLIAQGRTKYVAEMPEGHRLYDMVKDPEKIVSRNMLPSGIPEMDSVEREIKAAGYHGYYNPNHPHIPNAVAYFYPLNVKEEK